METTEDALQPGARDWTEDILRMLALVNRLRALRSRNRLLPVPTEFTERVYRSLNKEYRNLAAAQKRIRREKSAARQAGDRAAKLETRRCVVYANALRGAGELDWTDLDVLAFLDAQLSRSADRAAFALPPDVKPVEVSPEPPSLTLTPPDDRAMRRKDQQQENKRELHRCIVYVQSLRVAKLLDWEDPEVLAAMDRLLWRARDRALFGFLPITDVDGLDNT